MVVCNVSLHHSHSHRYIVVTFEFPPIKKEEMCVSTLTPSASYSHLEFIYSPLLSLSALPSPYETRLRPRSPSRSNVFGDKSVTPHELLPNRRTSSEDPLLISFQNKSVHGGQRIPTYKPRTHLPSSAHSSTDAALSTFPQPPEGGSSSNIDPTIDSLRFTQEKARRKRLSGPSLVRALHLARQAVQLDSENNNPHGAVLAYSESVALLDEVIGALSEGRGGEGMEAHKREEEIKRVETIVSTIFILLHVTKHRNLST